MPREALEGLWRSALAGVDPARAVRQALREDSIRRALTPGLGGRVGIFAVGKAAAGMFAGAAEVRKDGGLVVLPRGYAAPARASEVIFAAHPEPDRESVRAARRALAYASAFGPEDTLLCLVSGGTSSLLCLPRAGVTLREKRAAVRRLVRRGAPIEELNRMRVRLSAIKGGQLAAHTRARIVSLVLSDVSGDRPEIVGSGPTIRRFRGSRKHPRSRDLVRVVGSNRTGLEAASDCARAQGSTPIVVARRIAGEAVREGRRFAARAASLSPGEILLAGGEPTVDLGRRPGRGGRTLELALAAALELERLEASGVSLLAAASDGIDGSSDLAGAFADAETGSRARVRGLDPTSALERHDTARFFGGLGDGLRTGPTGTNVCDWVFAVRR